MHLTMYVRVNVVFDLVTLRKAPGLGRDTHESRTALDLAPFIAGFLGLRRRVNARP
jgi:hypothetical protein